jgi:cation-transporting ATPase 13A1
LVIEKRFPFSAALQRMSVVVREEEGGREGGQQQRVVLVKGSPEAMKPLFTPSSLPPSYDSSYQSLAIEGTRVLALGYKEEEGGRVDEGGGEGGREGVESGLVFAGFAAFRTVLRADSKEVIEQLIKADMSLCVLSGDSLLTSLAVAREVGMVEGEGGREEGGRKRAVVLEEEEEEEEVVEEGMTKKGKKKKGKRGKKNKNRLAWFLAPSPHSSSSSSSSSASSSLPPSPKKRRIAAYNPASLPRLALKYDLCAGGKALSEALKEGGREGGREGGEVGRHLHLFRVLARATPEVKEKVVRVMRREGGRVVLMCGDGANDVGALKEADCGVALLTGFGNANAARKDEGGREGGKGRTKTTKPLSPAAVAAIAAAEKKKERARMLKARQNFQKLLSEEFERARARDTPGSAWAYMKLFYRTYKKVSKEVFGSRDDIAGMAAKMWEGKEGREGEEEGEGGEGLDLKLGDASLAAPFTSKNPSIMCVPDLIRQGRASLARVQQQSQQGLSFSLSNLLYHFTLASKGARMGRRQLVVAGILGSVVEVGMRNIVPLPGIAPVALPQSVLHPSSLLSVLGQCAIQTRLTYGLLQTLEGEGGREDEAEDGVEAEDVEEKKEGGKEVKMADPLGSLMFLSQLVETAVGCVVTVKGRPFSTGIFDSPSLVFALVGLLLLPLLVALEVDVGNINRRLEVGGWGEGGREGGRKRRVIALNLLGQFVLPVAWDAAMLRVFAPEVGRARGRAGGREGGEGGREGGKKVGVALVAWAAILRGLVPWEGVVATLSMDPAEMMMSMATAGGGEGGEEGGGEKGGVVEQALPEG